MPDTNSHEFQIVAAARLCFKGENDRDWELLGISMGEEPSHNNVLHVVLNAQGINCEQHDNKDLVDSTYLPFSLEHWTSMELDVCRFDTVVLPNIQGVNK